MRVDLSTLIGQTNTADASAKPGVRPDAMQGSDEIGQDAANLSFDSANIQSLANAVYQLPEIRQERVSELSKMIAEGTYGVTPEQTAEALVSAMSRTAA